MLTTDQKEQFSDILEELGNSLDITETEYNAAVKSYQAIGEQLTKKDSELIPYEPEILPQGSFMLGTMVRPINDEDDLDIDLVCQLKTKKESWVQYDVKQKVGDQIKKNELYQKLLDDEGRRCWTLKYRDDSDNPKEKYHLDILPSIVDKGYRILLEKAFSDKSLDSVKELGIRITDRESGDYYTETNHKEWLKSNPFGYARWFFQQATLDITKAFALNESIKPVPSYSKNKLPLQRVVQILKRHRDMMFNGNEDKPISIIITTLASRAYQKETNILLALQNIINKMPNYIDEIYSKEHGQSIKWIANPVNNEENFADKWPDNPKKQKNFYDWLEQVKKDIQETTQLRGIHNIQESLEKSFGKRDVVKTFSSYGDKQRILREDNKMKMAAGTGLLGETGRAPVKQHNNFGVDE